MASTSLAQTHDDDVKPQGQRAPPSRSRKLVVIKVEPSYISSDLFTPFAEPRATLPSIAEFVRSSYHGDRTWGTTTSSYGGVGPASQQLKKRGCGSISRSHRHYGSGCINYSFGDSGSEDVHRCRSTEVGQLEVESCRLTEREPHEEKNHHVPVGMETASALKDVQASLYGTSSYNQDFASIVRARQRRQSTLPLLVLPEVMESLREPRREMKATLQEGGAPSDKDDEEICQKVTEANEETTASCDDSSDKEREDDEIEATYTSHGHMICTSVGSTVLPDHVIITDLSELPSHFRRVTTKYRRNRCPVFPCQVPFYLWRKHQLLPSSITTLPPSMTMTETNKARSAGHLPHLCHQTTAASQLKHKMTRFYQDKNALPKLGTVARKRPMASTGFVPMETRLPQQHLQGVRRYSHMTENLGRRFKSEAHTRYHTHFPDRVPDLQPVEPSKRHTFLGYHTSVFRG